MKKVYVPFVLIINSFFCFDQSIQKQSFSAFSSVSLSNPNYILAGQPISKSSLNNHTYHGFLPLQISLIGTTEHNINSFYFFPNPTTTFLYFNGYAKNLNFEIFSVTGQLVLQSNSQLINIESLSNGLYYINVKQENNIIYSSKFVKQ